MAAALKRLETIGKFLLALLGALALWRPGRKARAAEQLRAARRVLLVRIDDRVGEALLTTPLFEALKAHSPPYEVHALVHPKMVRALDGHPACDALIPFDRRGLALGAWAPGIRALRSRRYEVVVDCTNWTAPSITSALVCRLIAPAGTVIGPARVPSRWLQDVPVTERSDTRREGLQRAHLLSPLPGLTAPTGALTFRPPRPRSEVDALRGQIGAVVNPGGRLGARRIPASAFAAACRALLAEGRTPVITWGPGEEALAREVLSGAPGAVLAPPTDLDALSGLMAMAGLTVCNNTGPMHLSVAVGAPTLALFLRIEMERWGHPAPPNRMVDLTPTVEGGQDVDARVAAEVTAFARGLSATARR